MGEKEHILNLLKTLGGENINICGEIYEIIMKAESGPGLLQFFLENSEGIRTSRTEEAKQLFTKSEEQEYIKAYGKIVDGILDKLIAEKPDKITFYAELWEKITLKALFEDEKAQIFALYYVWIDGRIPYFELPESIHIEEGKYKEIEERLRSKLQNARFILTSSLEQWTEVSYLLLKLLDEIEQEDEKAVFLSCVMQLREKMIFSNLEQLILEKQEGNIG